MAGALSVGELCMASIGESWAAAGDLRPLASESLLSGKLPSAV